MTMRVPGESEERVIREAMEEWETYTCLTFKPAKDNKHKIVFLAGKG